MKKSSWGIAIVTVVVTGMALVKFFAYPEQKQALGGSSPELKGVPELEEKPLLTRPKKVASKEFADDYDPYQDEAFKAQLLEVADLYGETIKYPITSQPITNPEDVRERAPYEEAEVDLPFPDGDDDKDPIRVSAATEAYQYFEGDVIKLKVSISRVPEDEFAEVSGVLAGSQGDLPLTLAFSETNDSRTIFTASFDTRIAPPALMSREMLAKLTITIGPKDLFTTVGFRYAVASAEVVGVRPTFIDGANLVIPLQLNVYEKGYYFLSGVLEDSQTGQALIQLQSEARLAQGNAVLNLNAHIAALRQQGSEGPYVLRSIKSYRGSEVNEAYDSPASSAQTRFNIQGFPFSEYQDEEYENQQGQDSVDFLRDAGALENEGESL